MATDTRTSSPSSNKSKTIVIIALCAGAILSAVYLLFPRGQSGQEAIVDPQAQAVIDQMKAAAAESDAANPPSALPEPTPGGRRAQPAAD